MTDRSLAAFVSVIGQASAASRAATSVRCSLRAHLTAPLSNRGALVGSVKCGRRFGRGSYHGRYRDKVAPGTVTGSETGSSKLSFKAGTIRGTYTLSPVPLSGTAPFRGTFHVIGGTRRFKHMRGTLRMICAHRIPPLTDCTISGPVTGI